jgi:nickel-dependent lactate racemase
MRKFELPYGKTVQSLEIPDYIKLALILPNEIIAHENPVHLVEKSLDNPIGEFNFSTFQNARSVAIAINDKTRPVPNSILIPPLLKKLALLGIPKNSITFYIATGTHLPMTPEEFHLVLPEEILRDYVVVSHDCDQMDNLINLGKTKKGTYVLCNRAFYESDLKIVVGNIEPHHFMGFSGGMKSAAIGLAGRSTINQNHAMLTHPMARTGLFAENPMRQDVEEIGSLMGVHLALNTVLNGDGKIIHVLAGQPFDVMLQGIPITQKVCQVEVSQKYDLVIASVGGHPKDINLYQSQKALTQASMVTRDGGVVILVAACPEGSGSKGFEDFIKGIKDPRDVFPKFEREGFRIGPHKAFQFARELIRIKVILVSEMPSDFVRSLLLIPEKDVQTAFQKAYAMLPPNASLAIMPHAINTTPLLKNAN